MTYAPSMIPLDAAIPAPIRSPIPFLKAAILAALARRRARHDYACLLAADPHILADIGVSADDVRTAMRNVAGH